MEKKYYTLQDAAEYLGVHRGTLLKWRQDGALVTFKIGGRIFVDMDTTIKKAKEAQRCAM